MTAEFVRRAERGLGVAIREGQERGEVETRGEGAARGVAIRDGLDATQTFKPKPTDFARPHELSGVHRDGGIYAMTDGVSDEQFEEALTEARDEGNLTRANVARRCREWRPITRRPTHLALPALSRQADRTRAINHQPER